MSRSTTGNKSGCAAAANGEQRGTLLLLEIEDAGVGVFAHVRDELGLSSELATVQEISKGKITTAPEYHTGEGLFFTSKAVDFFRLASGAQAWIVDNHREDMPVAEVEPPLQGTLASVDIDLAEVRPLATLFDEYTQGHEFAKTRTGVRSLGGIRNYQDGNARARSRFRAKQSAFRDRPRRVLPHRS